MKTVYNTTIKIVCLVALSLVSLSVLAQEETTNNLNREMTLEREYDPSVQDANKVNTLPSIQEPEVRKIPIDYAAFNLPVSPAKEIGLLPSGKVMTEMEYNQRRGYLNFGGGTYLNLNGDFGYHILSTETDRLNVFLTHRSSNGKVEYLQVDEKVKAKFNDNIGGLNYSHSFDKAIFKVGANYGYSAFNYYGYNPTNYPERETQHTDIDTKQVGQAIKVYTGVASREGASLGYLLDLDYTHFGYKYGLNKDMDGVKEQTIGFKGDLNAVFNSDHRLGVGAQVKYFNYSNPEVPSIDGGKQFPEITFDNYAEITVSPYYRTGAKNWNVQLGINLIYITGDNDHFMFTPNVTAGVGIANKTTLYAAATGQVQSNSMYDVTQMNRYMNPTQAVAPTRHQLNSVIGIKSGVIPGFWFDVYGGYNIMKDDFLMVPNLFFFNENFGNFSESLGSIDFNHTFFGANLKYSYQNLFDIAIRGQYNIADITHNVPQSDPNADIPPYGRPEFELNAGISFKPIRNLTVGLDYYLGNKRCTLLNLSELTPLDDIHDLNLTGSYTFNDTFGVYLKLNNLMFQSYDLYYGYPAQGFNVMAGINLNF